MTTLAREIELASADRAARRRACEQFDLPLVVEAGAGTGKTTTLVARIVTWCVGPGWKREEEELVAPDRTRASMQAARAAEEVLAQDRARGSIHTERAQEEVLAPDRTRASARVRIRQADLFADADDLSPAQAQAIAERVLAGLVAITFTEAAAAEMGRRIRQALARLERGETPAWMYADLLPDAALTERRARALAAALDRLVVLTIHAWCQSLLSEFPLEAGLSPSFSVDADGLVIADAAREVLEARLVEALGDPPERDYLTLARRGFGPRAIEEALLALSRAGIRASDLADDPLTPERSRAFVADFAAEIEGFLARFASVLRTVGVRSRTTLDVLERLAESAARGRAASVDSPAALHDLCAGLRELWTDGARKRIDDWAKGKWTDSEARALADARGDAQAAAAGLALAVRGMCRLDPELLDCGRRVVADLLEALRARLRARGIEGFPDLLRDARDLLRDRPDVRRRVRRRMRQICVDEFQDTDPMQCELIRLAALDPIAGERADTHGPGLFLVGDPKQSIYGWRSADLGAYERTVADVLARGGERVRLSTNFRSTRRILAEVERAIRPVMEATSGVQPDFEALVPAREVEGERVEHWVSWELDREADRRLGKTRSEDACALEARLIARDILAAREAHGEAASRTATLLERGSSGERSRSSCARAPRSTSTWKLCARRRSLRGRRRPELLPPPRDHRRGGARPLRDRSDRPRRAALGPALGLGRHARRGATAAVEPGVPALITDLDGGDPSRLAPVEAAIERALALVPDDVPGSSGSRVGRLP